MKKTLAASTRYRRIKVGHLVRLKHQLETKGGRIFAKDLVMRVIHKRGGLHLTTINDKPCPACGVGKRHEISGVPMWDVEEVTDAK